MGKDYDKDDLHHQSDPCLFALPYLLQYLNKHCHYPDINIAAIFSISDHLCSIYWIKRLDRIYEYIIISFLKYEYVRGVLITSIPPYFYKNLIYKNQMLRNLRLKIL